MQNAYHRVVLGVLLLIASVVFYVLHYVIFDDPHHIFIYMVGDLAFVFVEVLLVTLIIHQVMDERDKKIRMEKLNMVIGSFFSEVGDELLVSVSDWDPELDEVKSQLLVNNDWSDERFGKVKKQMKQLKYHVHVEAEHAENMQKFLRSRREFLLRLLENPTLLEHASFTELLRAVFHLTEELLARKSFDHLPESDLKHLAGDVQRVYKELVVQWLDYMRYLKGNYPYLFSLAVRQNPFDQSASAVVKG